MNPAAAPPSGPKSMRPFQFSHPPEFPEIAPRDPGRVDRRPDPDRIAGATRRPPLPNPRLSGRRTGGGVESAPRRGGSAGPHPFGAPLRGARRRRPRRRGSEPPVSRILFPEPVARNGAAVMYLPRRLPAGSSDLPGDSPGGVFASLFGLAPCGVYRAPDLTARAVRSYRTFSPLPLRERRGGLFSVALSFRSPGLGVTQRTALRSSDFPPAPRREPATV